MIGIDFSRALLQYFSTWRSGQESRILKEKSRKKPINYFFLADLSISAPLHPADFTINDAHHDWQMEKTTSQPYKLKKNFYKASAPPLNVTLGAIFLWLQKLISQPLWRLCNTYLSCWDFTKQKSTREPFKANPIWQLWRQIDTSFHKLLSSSSSAKIFSQN